MFSMINPNKMKIKTVSMNERGVLVVPQDIREDLGIEGKATFVLIEKDNELILKKEEDVVELVSSSEDTLWKRLSEESLRRAWEKEDIVWDKLAKKMK